MNTVHWQPLTKENIAKVELGDFLVVARPDGKSWSGILNGKPRDGLIISNANTATHIHFILNPTASFVIMTKPKWELGFGQPRLDL